MRADTWVCPYTQTSVKLRGVRGASNETQQQCFVDGGRCYIAVTLPPAPPRCGEGSQSGRLWRGEVLL